MNRILPKDIKSNSIEKVICEAMSKLKSIPMTEDQTKVMLSFLMAPKGKEHFTEILKEIWTADAMIKRMKMQFDRDIDPQVAIIIALCPDLGIGGCLLYGYYMHWKANQLGITGEITFNDFAMKIFPWGMFSTEDIRKIWDSQKVYNRDEEFNGLEISKGTDNLIDYGYAAQSLMQKTEAT